MRFLLAFSLLVLSCGHLFSQREHISLKFSPCALGDEISFPTIQAGIEWKLSDKMSWYNELGIKYRKSLLEDSDSGFLPSRGLKVKIELRYYFKGHQANGLEGWYLGTNGFFTRDLHNTNILYRKDKDSAMVMSDTFGTKKNVFGLNLLMGYQKNISGRFAFEAYSGFGIRLRDIHTINREFDRNRDAFVHPVDLNLPSLRDETDANAGFSVMPNLTLGISFSYKF
jgi:hypothetical protein